jgi:hypothetical protein
MGSRWMEENARKEHILSCLARQLRPSLKLPPILCEKLRLYIFLTRFFYFYGSTTFTDTLPCRLVLPPLLNIRCFKFMKRMYLNTF